VRRARQHGALGTQRVELREKRLLLRAKRRLVRALVHALVDAIATLLPLHRDGKIKILGNFDDTRSPVAPEVPTFAEIGYPGLVAFTWFAVVAPARVPASVITKLNKAVMSAVESAETKRKFVELGFLPQTSSARELAAYIQSENDRWGPLIKKMGIQLD